MGSHAVNIINGEIHHTCTNCKIEQPRSQFYLKKTSNKKNGLQHRISSCKKCVKDKYSTKEGRERSVEYHLIKTYGINKQEYDEMLEVQDGSCLLCNKKSYKTSSGKVRSLSVDHCHETGKVRGLLCQNCNVGLGNFKDDIPLLRRAIEYLERQMDLKKIKLSDEVLNKAKEYSKGKTYKRSMRGEEGTNIGAIGEYVAKDYLEGFGLAVSDNRDTETATQYDFLVNGKSVEVKTKDRTVPPKSFYECSVPLYNHSHQKPDWFIFLSLYRNDSRYEDAYILGISTYDFIEKEGITVMKGEVDESNGWMCRESCINIPIDKLFGVERLILELNSI